MKKLFGLVLGICFLFSGNCLAMQFFQPEEIGLTGNVQVNRVGIKIDGATYNTGSYYTGNKVLKDRNTEGYEKGVAQYGKNENALYLHYNMHTGLLNFGGKNIANTIENRYPITYIYRINSDEGITLYPLYNTYGPELNYIIIGRRDDGKFVKYIDTNEITKRYFGLEEKSYLIAYRNLSTQGNTLIVEYQRPGNNCYIRGMFWFKWDEKAQWFGVEQGKEWIYR